MEHILIQFFIIGVLLVAGNECQEYMTLNVPSRAPFAFHPTEELSMDMSEMHPMFLYASSQNDFIHQNRPDHLVPNSPRPRHRQPNPQRQHYTNPPSHALQGQRNNKPRNNPSLTYGFQPKPSTRRHVNNPQRQKKFHPNLQKNQESNRFRGRHQQEPVHQGAVRQGNQHQSNHFSENIQVQTSAHQNRQNTNAVSNPNIQTNFHDFNKQFNYLTHILSPEKQFNTQAPARTRPNRNNQGHRNTHEENRKPVSNHGYRNQQTKEEHRQESVRKHVTFEDTAQAFKDRYTNHPSDDSLPLKTSNNYNEHVVQEKNHNNNERMNLQHHARSMRGENKPQLPPRPSFNNGGIRINTLAGELPVLHLDSVSSINENPAFYLQSNNHHDSPSRGEQEKKTYLLIKAPPLVTTESPSSAPFVVEALHHTAAPYFVNNFAETNVHVPELSYSTQAEPRTLSDNNVEPPAIVLDLVQIPDPTTYSHQDTPAMHHTSAPYTVEPSSIPRAQFRSAIAKEPEILESIPPTENYPTTPMHSYADILNHKTEAYSLLPEDNAKYQNKMIPKPKIKDLKKPSNISSFQQPISYSSSVSIVSVKQSVDSKQSPVKKQKTTLKKALSIKKKAKIPVHEDPYDDYDDGGQNVPGEAGVDYPTYKDIPSTSFDCRHIKSPGFYADLEAGCQVFHNCDTGKSKHSFMCPNGTIFHQELFICDWWYNVKCEDSPEFYSLNSGLFITNNAHDESRKKA